MTPADLKIRREALGLSQAWIAEQWGVQDRAVRRWEAGDATIPEPMDDFLREIEADTRMLIGQVKQSIAEMFQEFGEAEGIDVSAYPTDESLWSVHPEFKPMPASWHRAVLARALRESKVDVTFHFPARYEFQREQ